MTDLDSFDVYKIFSALNNHFFSPSYDYFQYNGSVRIKPETFEKKRSDEKYRYQRLANKFKTKEDLENFIVANLLESKKRQWIGNLFGGNADEIYLRWQGRTQAFTYNLTEQVKRLVLSNDGFNNLFKCEVGQHPEILKAYLRDDISIESFVLLDLCIGFVRVLESKLPHDKVWMSVRNKIVKYKPFLQRMNLNIPTLKKSLKEILDI